MKKIFMNFLIPILKIIVYLMFIVLFLVHLGKYAPVNILTILIVIVLLLTEVFSLKKFIFDKKYFLVDSEHGLITISDSLILQLLNKVVSNVENVNVEKSDVFINDNIINVDLFLNVQPNVSFYGSAHNIELALKRELNDLLGYDKEIKFVFNIERLFNK